MRKISVVDCTLRKLSENGSRGLLFREKLAISIGIDRFGADVIELPGIRNTKEDGIIFRTISQSVKNACIAIPAGTSREEAELAASCLKGAHHPRLIVSLPVSTVQMEYLYHMKAPVMLEKIRDQVRTSRELCEDVEFEALDATRCDVSFLIQACSAAESSGATCVTVCDDAGIMMPEEFASLVRSLKAAIGVPVNVKVSDSISLAVADALASVQAGGDGVKVCIKGSDSLDIDSFARALKTKGEQLGVSCNLKYTELHHDIESLVKKMQSHDEKDDNLPFTDSAVFLDSESTIKQVGEAVKSLGYDLSNEDIGRVYEALMRLCEQKSSIGSKELEAIVASTAMQVPATFRLVSYVGTMSNKVNSVTSVILDRKGEITSGTGTGNGPIDSAFTAIEQCIGHHYELDDFQIQAVTEGRESLGSTLVRLRSNGKLYSGNGISSDIVGASIRAYINALNKIAYEESQK
ncbi:MAG: hypothetical protein IJ663_05000 [Spirochaetales bacterium]|nr:hypothetical protein [Spirochaetales bacterium]